MNEKTAQTVHGGNDISSFHGLLGYYYTTSFGRVSEEPTDSMSWKKRVKNGKDMEWVSISAHATQQSTRSLVRYLLTLGKLH
jgi:hypothetical protein